MVTSRTILALFNLNLAQIGTEYTKAFQIRKRKVFGLWMTLFNSMTSISLIQFLPVEAGDLTLVQIEGRRILWSFRDANSNAD